MSCTSRSFCTAVGFTTLPDRNTLPLAEMWNGRRWSITTTPTGKSGQFTGVSCNSASACAAVGSEANGKGGTKNFAEEWNGSAWSIAATPATRGGDLGDLLNEVSCPSAADYTAAGFYWLGGDGTAQSMIWSWNGKRWSGVSTPSPTKTQANQLYGVACPSARTCTAVGIIAPDNTNNTRNLIETGRAGA
ncbi:MAG TPA: hypothetical protein VGM53_27160 [Streptosporangiaceae bacterium]